MTQGIGLETPGDEKLIEIRDMGQFIGFRGR